MTAGHAPAAVPAGMRSTEIESALRGANTGRSGMAAYLESDALAYLISTAADVALLSLVPRSVKAQVVDGEKGPVPILRVTLAGRRQDRTRVSRTVTSGIPLVPQLFNGCVLSAFWHRTLESVLAPELASLSAAMAEQVAAVSSDEGFKARVSEAVEKRAARQRARQRESLVMELRMLMAAGWTKEDVSLAWDEAVVGDVHGK